MKKKYYIDTLENGKIVLVKILNEYKDKEEAKKDLFKLATGDKTEKKILKEYSSKENF